MISRLAPLLILVSIISSVIIRMDWHGTAALSAPSGVILIRTCSENDLRTAIAAAHNTAAIPTDTVPTDTIHFQCSGTITVTAPLVLDHSMTLDAAGQQVWLDGQGKVPVIKVVSGVRVVLRNLHIRGGHDELAGGGAIDNRGNLTVFGGVLTNNADGIFNGKEAMLTVTGTIISHNEHGVLNYGGSVILNRVTLVYNVGVGVYNSNQVIVLNSLLVGNTHGIDNGSGDAIVVNSKFIGNQASKNGEIGAGIANSNEVDLSNSVFTANSAEGGAGIGSHDFGRVYMDRTVLTGNKGWNCYGKVIDRGHNQQSMDKSCGKTIPVLSSDQSDQ